MDLGAVAAWLVFGKPVVGDGRCDFVDGGVGLCLVALVSSSQPGGSIRSRSTAPAGSPSLTSAR